MENLVEVEPLREGLAGATRLSKADIKGKIIEFMWNLKREGYAEATIIGYCKTLEILARRGADLYNTDSVKTTIAKQNCSNAWKWNMCKAYTKWLKIQGLSWQRPRYKPEAKLPWIPQENEIDALIASCSFQMATVLELLKQSAARRLEAWQLKWSDIDFKTKTIHITTRKGGNPRIVRINDKLIAMLNRLPRKSERAFTYKNSTYMSKTFRKQRKRAVQKLGNPRIKRIHFHTLRHWRATMEYHRTKDILHVMQFLGHKRIENTLRYIQLEQMLYKESDDYICKIANNIKEAKDLIETGFDHICEYQDKKLFKKPK